MILIGMLFVVLVAALVALATSLPGGGRSAHSGPPRSLHADGPTWPLEAR
ncbi:hypothetical protein [Millisia brevis]|nr:hypothetical protein [Millisia brevis]